MLIARRILVSMLVPALLIALTAGAKPRKMKRLQTGDWGGNHIRLHVTDGGAEIEYDCAHGRINGPLTLDSRGRFSWRGEHNPERPGPTRADDTGSGQSVSYTGWVKGNTMSLTVRRMTMNLTVRSTGANDFIGTFALTRGGGGRVFKCR